MMWKITLHYNRKFSYFVTDNVNYILIPSMFSLSFPVCQRPHVKGSNCEIISGQLGNEKEKYHFQIYNL